MTHDGTVEVHPHLVEPNPLQILANGQWTCTARKGFLTTRNLMNTITLHKKIVINVNESVPTTFWWEGFLTIKNLMDAATRKIISDALENVDHWYLGVDHWISILTHGAERRTYESVQSRQMASLDYGLEHNLLWT
uniref:Uncharacterized protein n=1 Tax=Romanomermis culicivorax TaxID=13658 RepID=A0A915JCV9_ROMCU